MTTQLNELIAGHLNGTLQEDEKRMLAELLKVPENQIYLASKIDEQFLDEDFTEEVDDEVGKPLFKKIQEQIQQKGQVQVYLEDNLPETGVVHISWYRRRATRRIAVAAAFIILIVFSVVLWNNNRLDERSHVVQSNNKGTDSVLVVVHREVNTTGKDKRIQLPDGSSIVLADKSEVTYREPFTDQRDVALIGKASFKVAKDERKPFTVISNQVSTTALGTEFTVTAFAEASQMTVRLYEGKVVVKPLIKGNWRMKNDVYLSPGQEFVYSNQALAYVRTFNKNNRALEKSGYKEVTHDNPALPQNTKGSWYMFNNQSLGLVFDQLADMYNVQINYNKEDVANKYFVGRFNKSDSLDIILKHITKANRLTYTKMENTYNISK